MPTNMPIKYVEARNEAQRFLAFVHELEKRYAVEGDRAPLLAISGCKEAGAVKRASLDLSRALSRLRNP